MLEPVAKDQAPSVLTENIIEAFLECRSARRGTTLRDVKARMRRVLVRPKHGHYALAPAQVQHLISIKSKGGKESKSIVITSVVKVPGTIPKGKELENQQTPLFANGLN